MPIGGCDPSQRQPPEAHNQTAMEQQIPAELGGGSVLYDVLWDWDRVSIWPICDGPVVSIHVRNTGTVPVWALLPNKKRAPLWVKLDAGAENTVTQKGTFNNLGLTNFLDVVGVGFWFTDPAVNPPPAGAAPKG